MLRGRRLAMNLVLQSLGSDVMDLKEAAIKLGVHYQTAYQWVREGRLPAQKVGTSYQISSEDVERLMRERAMPTPPPRQVAVKDWSSQRQRLLSNLLKGDENSARGTVNRLAEGRIPVVDLCEKLFTPVLFEIGELWDKGAISVAEEHRSSAIVERTLGNLMSNPPGRPRGVAIVVTPLGEEHVLPAVMAAAVLRQTRWITHYLGAQVPVSDVVDLCREVRADIAVISVTMPDAYANAVALAQAMEAVGVTAHLGGKGRAIRDLLRVSDDSSGFSAP